MRPETDIRPVLKRCIFLRLNFVYSEIVANLVVKYDLFNTLTITVMVRYCVMWKFKPSECKTSKELAEDVKEKYESLLGLVPGLKSIEVGVNRNEGKTSYDAVMLADFDSWESLAAYKADTLRGNVIEYVKTIADVRAKVEYER